MEPPATPRRRDRAVEDEAWIRAFLEKAPHGTLAVATEGAPHVNMNLFVYDHASRSLFFHTARLGATRSAAEEGPRASFSVAEMGRLLPASTALEFSVEYAGVVCVGRLSVVDDKPTQRRALELLLDKYAPHLRRGVDYADATAHDLSRTTVYRLRVDSWTAKRKVAPPDQAGAFRYGETPSYRGPLPDET